MSIQISFITENNIASWLVRCWTWSKYSHVDLIIPGKGYLGARPHGGVQLRQFGYTKVTHQAIGTIECTPEQEAQIIAYAMRQIGKPYDWLNIFGMSLHQDWTQEPRKWICSVLIWAAFHSAGIDLINPENIDRPTPGDLAESPYVKLQVLE